jgi:hypothetical protein
MADNTQDLKDSTEQLGDFNRALQDSINLSKQISSNIAALAGGMDSVDKKGKLIVADLNDYQKSLSKTVSLTEKLATGRLKEKEVTDQISSLQQKYNTYLEDSRKRSGYFVENRKRQKELEKEIGDKKQLQVALDIEAEKLYDERRKQLQIIKAAEEKIAEGIQNGNNVTITQGKTAKKLATDRLKTLDYEVAEQTRIIVNQEKLLSEKQKEFDSVKSINEAHKDLKKKYEEEIEANEILLDVLQKQSFASKLFNENFEQIGKNIQNSLLSLTSFSTIFSFIKNLAFGISDQVTKLQKGLVLSRDEAYQVREEFNGIALAANDGLISTNRLIAANVALGKQLGFNKNFGADLNTEFVRLTKQLGLSEEAAGGLAKLSVANGRTLKDTKNAAYGTVQALSSQYGIQLRQQDVLEEVGKVSGQTLAMFKASPEALTQAVAQARLLGTTLETTKKQAASLLNFETSIENELQAELLTGEQLNLERARAAALMGDQKTVMSELASQNMDFNRFSNMNVIAQNKFADALGLTSDELSDQLLKTQYMNMSREQVAALAGEEVAERVEAINAQDRFNAAMEHLKDIVAGLVGGPLGKMVDIMASLADSSLFLYGTLTAMAGISLVKLISSLISVAATLSTSAIAGTATASALTFGLAAAGIIAGIGAVAAAMGAFTSDAQDQAQDAGDINYSNGKTQFSPKEGGLFNLSDNDDALIGPGIGDLVNNRSAQTIVAQDNSEMLSKFDALIAKMDSVNSGIGQLNNKEGKVLINGQAAGTAQLMGNYNLA